ncbi:MAG: TIR domain-containing protein [Acidobacteriota bacterium]|nr:TIR domain-containing protein [Acidobacteriota bacterium]MDQ5835309.1 TIR domain-containing protein [Acidobacteriota bacterium]
MKHNAWRPFRRRPLKIVICYRREDSVDSTGRLYRDLNSHFNRRLRNYLNRKVVVVRDFDSIPAGTQYEDYIKEEIETSAAVLTVIGNDWLKVTNPQTGHRRIDEPEDTLRKEIMTALSFEKPIIPVLVERAKMPEKEALPDALKPLATTNAREVNDPEWDAGSRRLIKDLEAILYSPWSTFAGIALALGAVILLSLIVARAIPGIVSLIDGRNMNVNVVNSPTPLPSPRHTPTPTPANSNQQPSPKPTSTQTPAVVVANSNVVATPLPTPKVEESLEDTQWEFRLSGQQNAEYVWEFHPQHRFRARRVSKGTYLPDGTWTQDGDKVTIRIGDVNSPEVYKGTIHGNEMKGDFIALNSGPWTARKIVP